MTMLIALLVLIASPAVAGDKPAAPGDAETACWNGDPEACRKARELLEKKAGTESFDEPRVLRIAHRGCELGERHGCESFLFNSPPRFSDHWPRTDAVAVAPEELVDFVRMDNLAAGLKERPTAARAKPEFLALVKAALEEIPAQVLLAVRPKLAGIFLVENLGSTAYNLDLFGPSGSSESALLVLDAGKLDRRANEWASWKENTPFAPAPGFRLDVKIEEAAGDQARNAIQFILLHELGHVLERTRAFTPALYQRPEPGFLIRYPFLSLSWQVTDRGYVSNFDRSFAGREKIRFYADKPAQRLPISRALGFYRALENTDFPSLYSATGPNDDFAESFAGYVHVVLQKRPQLVTLTRGGKPLHELKACWDQPRCQDKRRFFEKLFPRAAE